MIAHVERYLAMPRTPKTLKRSQTVTNVLFVVLHHSRQHPGIFQRGITGVDSGGQRRRYGTVQEGDAASEQSVAGGEILR